MIKSDFSEFHKKNVGSNWNCERVLAVIDKDGAAAMAGPAAAFLLDYEMPILRFSCAEQQLLEAAVDGLTDVELGRALHLNLPAIKKRWASTIDRVAKVMPGLLPGPSEDPERKTRGLQKRHHLLAYLRRHPEELRPFVP